MKKLKHKWLVNDALMSNLCYKRTRSQARRKVVFGFRTYWATISKDNSSEVLASFNLSGADLSLSDFIFNLLRTSSFMRICQEQDLTSETALRKLFSCFNKLNYEEALSTFDERFDNDDKVKLLKPVLEEFYKNFPKKPNEAELWPARWLDFLVSQKFSIFQNCEHAQPNPESISSYIPFDATTEKYKKSCFIAKGGDSGYVRTLQNGNGCTFEIDPVEKKARLRLSLFSKEFLNLDFSGEEDTLARAFGRPLGFYAGDGAGNRDRIGFCFEICHNLQELRDQLKKPVLGVDLGCRVDKQNNAFVWALVGCDGVVKTGRISHPKRLIRA